MLCSEFFHRRAKRYEQLNRLIFHEETLQSWFEARALLDWSHLAHHVAQHTQTSGPSIYTRHSDYTTPAGIPVSEPDGSVHYENEWTLPMSAVCDIKPGYEYAPIHDQMRRLKCLLELVEASDAVFPGLSKGDRELLAQYWKVHGKKPKGIRKSKIDEKMARQDKKAVKISEQNHKGLKKQKKKEQDNVTIKIKRCKRDQTQEVDDNKARRNER